MAFDCQKEKEYGCTVCHVAFMSVYYDIGINKCVLLTYYSDYMLKWG